MLNLRPIIARVPLADGRTRAVYEGPDGRQFVLDNDGEPVFGVWVLGPEDADEPAIVHPGGVARET